MDNFRPSLTFLCSFVQCNLILVYHWQTQVIAAAAAGVAAEGLSPTDAKAEAENAAQLSVSLVENAIVILMLVEDHLRLQSKLSCASSVGDGYTSPLSLVSPLNNRSHSLTSVGGREPQEPTSICGSISSEPSGLPLDVCLNFFNFKGRHPNCIYCLMVLPLELFSFSFFSLLLPHGW